MSYRGFVERNLERYVDELRRFASIASVASQGTGIQEAASFVSEAFARRGFAVETIATAGNPVVVAQRGTGPTMLLYNHYDVQPADPLDAWTSPPFEPQVRDGKMYARGIIDDKGEILARLAAIDALVDRFGDVPLCIKTCIEGEEEIGSPNLAPFLAANRDRLAADACIWEAGMVDDAERPRMWLGVRGLVYVRLHVRTMAHDAHSGWAHALPNAAWRLVHALGTLKGDDERVLVEGFYDDVLPPSEGQRVLLEALPDEEAEYRSEYDVKRFAGGRSASALTASVFEPTCNISGIQSGHTQAGSKTVIPSEAFAKLDFRLVPNQRPEHIVQMLRAHLDRHGFSDVIVEAAEGSLAACTDPADPFIGLTVAALRDEFGTEPVVTPLVGGTGPASLFVHELGVPFVSIGCSYPAARKHAPDENLRLSDFVRGAAAIALVLERFARRR